MRPNEVKECMLDECLSLSFMSPCPKQSTEATYRRLAALGWEIRKGDSKKGMELAFEWNWPSGKRLLTTVAITALARGFIVLQSKQASHPQRFLGEREALYLRCRLC